jgi:hypothetical protein
MKKGLKSVQIIRICANHKNLRHLRAKKQIAAFDRAEHINDLHIDAFYHYLLFRHF